MVLKTKVLLKWVQMQQWERDNASPCSWEARSNLADDAVNSEAQMRKKDMVLRYLSMLVDPLQGRDEERKGSDNFLEVFEGNLSGCL